MIRIAVIGPESTGKTELCRALSLYYDCVWEPELARGYIESLGRSYTRADVEEIARLQIEQEKKYETAGAGMVFFDTDLIITKVWFQYKYHGAFVVEEDWERFDFCLLAMPDIPWSMIPYVKTAMILIGMKEKFKWEPYEKVWGVGDERLENVAVDGFLMGE